MAQQKEIVEKLTNQIKLAQIANDKLVAEKHELIRYIDRFEESVPRKNWPSRPDILDKQKPKQRKQNKKKSH